MTGIILGLLGAIAGPLTAAGALYGGIAVWRTSKATAAKTNADIQQETVTWLRDELREVRSDVSQLRADLDAEQKHSRAQDARITILTSIVTRLRAKVAPLVGWIDAGAEPPAPIIDDELRSLLRDHD